MTARESRIRERADAEDRAAADAQRKAQEARIARDVDAEELTKRLTEQRLKAQAQTALRTRELEQAQERAAAAQREGRLGEAFELRIAASKAAQAFQDARDTENAACIRLHQHVTHTAPPRTSIDPNAYDPATEGVFAPGQAPDTSAAYGPGPRV